MTPPALRLLLLDDHPLFRTGLRLVLERTGGHEVVGEAGDGDAALDLARRMRPDLVVADIHLPGEDGIGFAARLRAACPSVRTLFLSSEADPAIMRRALDGGACGYLLKDTGAGEILRAIEAAARDGIQRGPELVAALAAAGPRPDPAPPALSGRETSVLRLLAAGLRNKEIAALLAVSPKTVETYRRRLMDKLGYRSGAELVRHAVREGLVAP